MRAFIKHFRREGPGVWTCISQAELDLPSGRIQVLEGARFTLGERFMGVDVARILEDEFLTSTNG